MSPEMVLLMDNSKHSIVSQTGDLLANKCNSLSWEVRDSALECVYTLSLNANSSKYTYFCTFIKFCQGLLNLLIEVLTCMSLNNIYTFYYKHFFKLVFSYVLFLILTSLEFPAHRSILLDAELPQLVLQMALHDGEFYVRATAFKCLHELIQISEIWNVLINGDQFLVSTFYYLGNGMKSFYTNLAKNTSSKVVVL